MSYYKKDMNKPLNLNSNNSESYSENFNKRKIFIEQESRGRSINTVPAAVEKDSTIRSFDSNSTVGRHTEALHQTDSHQSVLGAPAPGISVGSATRRDKMQRFLESLSGAILKRMMVLPGVQSFRLCCLPGRKWTSAESSSPEDSHLIPPIPEQVYLKNKDAPDFKIYQVITSRPISRNEFLKKMDEDFILKITDSGIFYKDYYNSKNSLKYLIYKSDIKNNKYINLKEEQNEIFNRFLNELDKDTKEKLRLKKQLAFIRFRKKDGSFDMDKKVYKKYDLPKQEHTEDKIFEQLLEIYNEDDCCYSEIYIFSTNSLCLARDKYVPCMIQAVVIAKLLYKKHEIKTTIGYLKPWGFIGSYEIHLPEYSIKKCIYNFLKESQTLGSKYIINNSPQKPTTEKVDIELLIPVYEQIIPEVENKKFLMKDNKSTATKIKQVKRNLAQFYSKISKPEMIKSLHNILSDLYKKENSDKTFGDFEKHGLDTFKKSKKKIKDLLIEHEDIYKEIKTYLKNDFFPWWAKIVEDAFSKFLKKETCWFLQESAVCLFLREITETEPFFDIGYVILENLII